jgi:hypothetical protein
MQMIDDFTVSNQWSPHFYFFGGLLMCCLYPDMKRWNTGRKDSIITIAVAVGYSIGSYLNAANTYKQNIPPNLDLMTFLRAYNFSFMLQRIILGLVVLLMIKIALKICSLRLLCFIFGLKFQDPSSKQKKFVELPYYFFTYLTIGIYLANISQAIFRHLQIEDLFNSSP